MQVKRYIGEDAHDAMTKVKLDLGMDAVILHTRKIRRKGIRGLFSKPMVEMVAAVEQKNSAPRFQKPAVPKAVPNTSEYAQDSKLKDLEDKISMIDKMVKDHLIRETFAGGRVNSASLYRAPVQDIYNRLIDNEVAEDHAKLIAEKLNENYEINESNIEEAAMSIIKGMLGTPEPISLNGSGQKVVVFAGPTGIGKTTTLAKLAAIFTLNYGKKVGFITTDTYRIGAPEQLKVYADLLKLPFQVLYDVDEIEDALKSFEECDLVLIDTAGKNTKDSEYQNELTTLLNLSGAEEVFLVISAATGHRTCFNILSSYEYLKDYKLIVTKLDEVESPGIILSARMASGKPISYITNGQNVPDDILVFDPEKLAKSLITKKDNQL